MADVPPEEPAPEPRRPAWPLGAPADPLRPTGRVQDRRRADPQPRSRVAARVRMVLLGIALTVAAVVLFALLAVLGRLFTRLA